METPKYFFQYRDDAQKLFLREYVYALGTFHYNWHDEIELLVILRGRADICTGGCVYQLEEDDMILINSNEGHATLARSADCLAFLIRFSPTVFEAYDANYRALRFQLLTDSSSRAQLPYRLLRMYMTKMLLAMETDEQKNLLQMQSGLYPLLELLQSQFRQTASGKSGISNSRSRLLVQQMIQYIEKHYQEKVTLNSLAEQMGYNPSYLSQLFRDNVGVNFYDYVTRKRLRESIFALQQTDKKILDIATDSGFQDIKAFNTKFKEVFGRTPSEYRRSLTEITVPRWSESSHAYVERENSFVEQKPKSYLHLESVDMSTSENAFPPLRSLELDRQLLDEIALQLEKITKQIQNRKI